MKRANTRRIQREDKLRARSLLQSRNCEKHLRQVDDGADVNWSIKNKKKEREEGNYALSLRNDDRSV